MKHKNFSELGKRKKNFSSEWKNSRHSFTYFSNKYLKLNENEKVLMKVNFISEI